VNPVKALLYRRAVNRAPDAAEREGMARSQALAYACAKAIAAELREGWTEAQAARLMDVYLADHGVRGAFHKSFAWFGERSRFDGMRRWRDFLPSGCVLEPGDAVILDTAPFLDGFPADIGYSFSCGPNEKAERARGFLRILRREIPGLFAAAASRADASGGGICAEIARRVEEAGYDAAHHRYPGGVLGHRLHAVREGWRPPTFTPFGFQAVARLVAGGVYPELLNEEHRGGLQGAKYGGPDSFDRGLDLQDPQGQLQGLGVELL